MMCRKLSPLVALCLLLAGLMVALPAAAEQATSEQVAAAPSTADQSTAVASRCQRCGDGYCARSCENEFTCPADCAPQTKVAAARCGKCGDGTCVRQCGETPESCPVDCGGSPSESAPAETKRDECAPVKSADAAAPRPDAKKE